MGEGATTAWAAVLDRIEDDDAAGVVHAFDGLSERDRRALAEEALAHYRRDDLNAVAGLAVLATGTRADVDRLWPGVVAVQPEASAEILAARGPAWLEGWLERLCEREPRSAWSVARNLRRRGLYSAESPAYALAFLAGIGTDGWVLRKPIYDLLLADRSLLDDELWQAFQIEGGGDTSFAAHDKYRAPGLSWSAALRRLVDEGAIDRQRLIDATLNALALGFSAFRAGWFVRFHEELALTDGEQRARLDTYLELVASPTAQVQSFAVRTVAALEKAGPLPAVRVVRALRPAVLNRAKATVTQALRILEAAAARSEEAASAATLVAVEALAHEAPDVQARALALLERHADFIGPVLADALAAAAPAVAPSLRPRLDALLGGSAAAPASRVPIGVSRSWPDSILDVAVLDSCEPIAPVRTAEELALVVALALEHPGEIDSVERAIDGISRLGRSSRLEHPRMWPPVRKRAQQRLRADEPFAGRGVAVDFAATVAAWLDQRQPARSRPPMTVMGFLSLRLHALAQRAARGEERALLSAPTHGGGWIDPEVLVGRVAAAPEPVDRADLVLALLRLAPDRRDRALAAAADLSGEAGAAVRFALGSDRERRGRARELWVAAARARYPGRDAPDAGRSFRKLGAGGTNVVKPRVDVQARTSGRYTWHYLVVAPDVPGKPPSLLYPTVVMHAREAEPGDEHAWFWWRAHGCGTGAETEADVRWCATLQPADLEPYFLEGLARIGNNLDWWEAHWEDRAFLEPLLELRTSLSDVAVRLLTLALAAKEPGVRGLAAEATADALADGRLTSRALGEALGDAWSAPLVTPRRFALSLAAVVAASPQSRGPIREAMTLGLRAKPHADAAQILELFHELCHAEGVGVDDARARSSLASYTSGKAGRLAKSVLALDEAAAG